MTDRTNVITVTQDNLAWINENVPGTSKQKRLEKMLKVYQDTRKEYNDLVKVLEEQERKGKLEAIGPIGDLDFLDVSIRKYELLHMILGIEGEPRWSS